MTKRRRKLDQAPLYFIIKDERQVGALGVSRTMAVHFTAAVISGATIVLVVPDGTTISDKLQRVVDDIEFYEPADPASMSEAARRALLAARAAPQ